MFRVSRFMNEIVHPTPAGPRRDPPGPVVIWNLQHDWASFRFQSVRATASHQWSLRTLGEFIGLQFGMVGFVLLPVVLTGVALTAWRGFRQSDPVAILLSSAVIFPLALWRPVSSRSGAFATAIPSLRRYSSKSAACAITRRLASA